MKKSENVLLQNRLLVESLREICEKEAESLVHNELYMSLEAANNKAENTLMALIKDFPEIRAAFDDYCTTRIHRDCCEAEAMFFEGYFAALNAIGEHEKKMQIMYAKHNMDRERVAS